MSLRVHPTYQRLIEKARASYQAGRRLSGIDADDIALARLYGYAFRGHVIGAFHGTQQALAALQTTDPDALGERDWQLASELLKDLAAQALDPIAADVRALLSTLHRYDTNIRRVLGTLDRYCQTPAIKTIRDRFAAQIEKITASGGIVCMRDDEVPPQASLVVPGLGITIAPLVYGDHHSWNVAFLDGDARDVPRHWHQHGVEIHLGFGHVQGVTLLGDERAEVAEGYAMAIPPRTPHGFVNTSGGAHYLPFIFGSKQLGGWGVLPDVEPQPVEIRALKLVARSSQCLNGLVYLDREIERATQLQNGGSWTIVEPRATYRPESGALNLSISRVGSSGLTLPIDSFRIVSVVRGAAVVSIGPAEQKVTPHDHFGIPAGLAATLKPMGGSPLVILDAVLVQSLESDGK